MTLETELYPYQKAAVEKLLPLRIGALYMEMGTGKTRTALEIIKQRMDADKLNTVIWLCPCSVKQNLENDIIYHCGELPEEITICGIETLSTSAKWNTELKKLCGNKTMIIVDESNLIKNHKALRTEHITYLGERCRYRMILNGTPITKNYVDLFSQWYFLDWRVLGYKSFYSFAANHIVYDTRIPNKIVNNLNVDYLVRRIAPYSYQVLKSEVLDLPQKHYHVIETELTEEQEQEYYNVANILLDKIDECVPETIYRMFSALQAVISGNYVYGLENHITTEPMFFDPLDNPRIQKMLSCIENQIQEEKCIIFCKYTQEIKDIIKALNDKYGEDSAVEYTGNLTQKRRNESIEKFKDKAQFLVANKTCAGYGLNLQFCRNIIFYNNDFNWGTRQQAEDRIHRIGQTNDVHIWDIICNGTLDEPIHSCLLKKEGMFSAFTSEMQSVKDNKEIAKKWIFGRKQKVFNIRAAKRTQNN